jgi:hypothetical protein
MPGPESAKAMVERNPDNTIPKEIWRKRLELMILAKVKY